MKLKNTLDFLSSPFVLTIGIIVIFVVMFGLFSCTKKDLPPNGRGRGGQIEIYIPAPSPPTLNDCDLSHANIKKVSGYDWKQSRALVAIACYLSIIAHNEDKKANE